MALQWVVAEDDAPVRLDRYLRKRLRSVPLSHVYKLIRTGKVRVAGARAKEGRMLRVGEAVEVDAPEERQEASGIPPARPAAGRPARPDPEFKRRVLYEDDCLMVVDKPAGLLVHPSDEGEEGAAERTLLGMVRTYLGARAGPPDASEPLFAPTLVHRLDQQTSGALLVAKTGAAMRFLQEAFREGKVEKEYLALVAGVPRERRGVIELGLEATRDEETGRKIVRVSRSKGALTARTAWAIAQAWRGAALLSVALDTGRTHQIRVHLKAIGHPVAGDARYGDFAFNRRIQKEAGLRRLFLHAHRLAFPHPERAEPVEVISPLPPELGKVVERLTDKRF